MAQRLILVNFELLGTYANPSALIAQIFHQKMKEPSCSNYKFWKEILACVEAGCISNAIHFILPSNSFKLGVVGGMFCWFVMHYVLQDAVGFFKAAYTA